MVVAEGVGDIDGVILGVGVILDVGVGVTLIVGVNSCHITVI